MKSGLVAICGIEIKGGVTQANSARICRRLSNRTSNPAHGPEPMYGAVGMKLDGHRLGMGTPAGFDCSSAIDPIKRGEAVVALSDRPEH
jgi:hypothetical protein